MIKPGGEFKIMVYNVWSICTINAWVKHALLKGRPWKTIRWAVWNYIESIGMKVYSVKELRRMLSPLHDASPVSWAMASQSLACP